jgi:hypothetical protein
MTETHEERIARYTAAAHAAVMHTGDPRAVVSAGEHGAPFKLVLHVPLGGTEALGFPAEINGKAGVGFTFFDGASLKRTLATFLRAYLAVYLRGISEALENIRPCRSCYPSVDVPPELDPRLILKRMASEAEESHARALARLEAWEPGEPCAACQGAGRVERSSGPSRA